ncbi:MAG: HNH endonuclease signature motif containing protein, partial [Ilumatobacteraceae bacterium]
DRDGNALDAGRTIRHAGRTQRRALRAMYRTCAIGGCDVPFERCEIHQIVPWEVGGATDLANLVPACSRHHHLIHELDWRLNLHPDRTLDVTGPDGTPIATGEPDVPPQRRRPNRRRRPAA